MELPILGRIFGILIGVYFLYKTFILTKSRRESLFEFFLWTILGVVLIVFAVYPASIDKFSEFLGTSKGANAVFAMGILTLFFLTFFIFKMVKNIRYDISKLNETMSIMRAEKDTKSKNSPENMD